MIDKKSEKENEGALDSRKRLKSVSLLLVAMIICVAAGILFQKYVGIESIRVPPPVEPINQEEDSNSRPTDSGGEGHSSVELETISWNDETKEFDTVERDLHLEKCAVVLIDVWETPDDELIKQKLVPLLVLARGNHIQVIHGLHGRESHQDCVPLDGEFVVESREELDRYLRKEGINVLLYAGFSTNECLIDRPDGIIDMERLGYDIILLQDCTKATETAASEKGKWAWREAVNMVIRNWGSATTLGELQETLE